MPPDAPITLAFVMTGEVYRNSRAIKQLRTLAAAGYAIEVVHVRGEAPEVSLPAAVSVRTLRRPTAKGPLFFWQIDRLFQEALSTLHVDIVHASDLYALGACRRRADTLGCALTYDAREYYPHVAGTVGKPWSRWWWQRVEEAHVRRADAVFTVSESIATALASDYGIKKPYLVYNAPPTIPTGDAFDDPGLKARIGTSAPVFVHLGQMKAHRGGPALIEALTHIDRVHLVFLGYGSEKERLQTLSARFAVADRVHFLEPVPPDGIRAAIRDADAGISMLEDTCLNHRYALPNKLFDYIHAGLPVLGADLPEIGNVLSEHDIGLTSRPDRPEQIAKTMEAMLDVDKQAHWRANLPAAGRVFAWEETSRAFLAGMTQACKRSG